jgi:zinc/manganese transport system substrate-binding protein
MRTSPRPLCLALAVVAALGTYGCSGDGAAAGAEGLHVVATHPILGDIVRNVVGDAGTVEVIVPAGADPHEFQPSAKQVASITEADLVVANGFAFEEGLRDALDAAADSGADVFEMASAYEAPRESADGDGDPHIWFDPAQMAVAVEALGAELGTIDAGGGWERRAAAYAAEIRAADADVERTLAAVPDARRKLVTNHDTLGYLASRYGFEIVGAAIPSTTTAAAASAANLADLAETIETSGVPAVFAEVSAPADLARALADETDTDVEVVLLLTETLAPEGEDGDSYLGLLRVDAERIAEALGR